jgi:transposase
MPTTFRPCSPDQVLLFPPSPRDWLPEGHVAFFILDAVAALDLQAFYAPYEGDGRRNAPFDPQMMVRILLYGYVTGTFSSRGIARKLQEDVAYRVLAAGNFPAHRTIAEFRQRHLADFEALFVQVVQLAREAGVITLGTVAVDGSKVRAHASKHKAMSYKRMREDEQRLQAEIADLLAQAEATDAAEDARHGADRTGEELPAELQRRDTRLATIQAAKARLEARQAAKDRETGRTPDDGRKGHGTKPYKRDFGVPEDRAQENFTDPDSRIMKTGDGYQQCYNGQVAVDAASQLIVATRLSNVSADQGTLVPLVAQVCTNLAAAPAEVLADAGFRDEATFVTLEQRGIPAYVSLGREGKVSPAPSADTPATGRMAEALQTDTGKAKYRRRKAIVEPVFGWLKHILGFRRFSVRGLTKVTGEWSLVWLAVNLKRCHRLRMALAAA